MAGWFQFLKRLLAASWGQAIAAFVMLASLPLYSGMMTPENFGVGMLAMATLALLDGAGTSTFAQVLAQVLKDLELRSERRAMALGLSVQFSFVLGVLAAIVCLAAIALLGSQSILLLALSALGYCLIEGPRLSGQTIALLERRFGFYSIWKAAEAVTGLIVTLAIIALTDGDPVSLVLGSIAARSFIALIAAPLAMGSVRDWHFDLRAARTVQKKAIAFAWPIAVSAPVAWLGLFADRYLVAATAGVAAAGVLAGLSGAITRAFSIVSGGLTNMYRPDLLDLAAGREPHHSQPLRRWVVAGLTLGFCGVAGFALIAEVLGAFLISFPTPGIDRAGLIIAIAFSQLLVLPAHGFDNWLLARGRSRTILMLHVGTLLIGLPLIALGAAWYGVMGAAIGRIANEALKLGAAAMFVRKIKQREAAREISR